MYKHSIIRVRGFLEDFFYFFYLVCFPSSLSPFYMKYLKRGRNSSAALLKCVGTTFEKLVFKIFEVFALG